MGSLLCELHAVELKSLRSLLVTPEGFCAFAWGFVGTDKRLVRNFAFETNCRRSGQFVIYCQA